MCCSGIEHKTYIWQGGAELHDGDNVAFGSVKMCEYEFHLVHFMCDMTNLLVVRG